jgi:hypothetical protein
VCEKERERETKDEEKEGRERGGERVSCVKKFIKTCVCPEKSETVM